MLTFQSRLIIKNTYFDNINKQLRKHYIFIFIHILNEQLELFIHLVFANKILPCLAAKNWMLFWEKYI